MRSVFDACFAKDAFVDSSCLKPQDMVIVLKTVGPLRCTRFESVSTKKHTKYNPSLNT